MRAFRPSQYAPLEEGTACDQAEDEVRSVNVQMYAKRAEMQQPLFMSVLPVEKEAEAR